MNIVEVWFDYSKSTSFFKNNDLKLRKNLFVVVNTEKGVQYGKLVQVINDCSKFNNVDLFDVIRISNKKDYFRYVENLNLEKKALKICKECVLKHKLNMNILDAHYSFDKSQLLFRFVAEERVDFRNLAKELGSIFKTRIELRQIGIRDKAKEVGGIGPCGRRLCCSSFLKSFDSVTINMAKNQNVSLNPSKINGVCGRLLCCLRDENEFYANKKKKFPKIGSLVSLSQGKGKVVGINLLYGNYTVELENKVRIVVDCNESKE